MAKLFETIQAKTTLLKEAGIEEAAQDARRLTREALKLDRAELITQKERLLSQEELEKIETLITRRSKREPVGRILGEREFWGLPFKLNEATLEPRPDSETLIEVALKRLQHKHPRRILDLGTGTGCLLLALLHEWQPTTGVGIDQSERAVQQAKENADLLKLEDKASFQTGDWLQGITEKFDLIISNPPYIPNAEAAKLQPEVSLHDPSKALFGGVEGLDPYTHLIPRLSAHLNTNSLVLFEVGQGQAAHVAGLMKQNHFNDIEVEKDLGGVERCVSALWQPA